MHSDIKIRCTLEDMEDLFDNNETFSVRHYKMVGVDLFKCTIRHKELEKNLSGTYSISKLKSIFDPGQTEVTDLKKQLQEKLSGLRYSFNEVNSALEWSGLEETYPLASRVFREIEELEKLINSIK